MNQRGFAEVLILYAIIAIVAVAAIGGAVYKVNHWCNTVCEDARAEVVMLKAEKAAAQERATAIALLWSGQVDKTASAESQLETLRHARAETVRAAAAALPAADRGRVVPAAVVRVLDSAAGAANSAGTTTGAEKAAPTSADTSLGVLTDWAVVVTEIHAECRDRVAQWETFYAGLRAAQGVP